ncbi:MAG: hypothetical protein PUK70_05695 [Bacteroidales bacterium]|nr:hypothetical protein [Bacteroidales bacterium]MDY6001623.1 hypothetical protein [Candidatus Cryptobacteroides sp.]
MSDDQATFDALVQDIWDSKRANVYEVGSVAELVKKAGIEPQVVLPYNTGSCTGQTTESKFSGLTVHWIRTATLPSFSMSLA